MNVPTNPFPSADADRQYIWQRQIIADSEAFAAGDWKMIENDFDAEHFEGLRAMNSTNPDDWQIVFPSLESYRDSWLALSAEFRKQKFAGLSPLEVLYARCSLGRIVINEDRAFAVKKFVGIVQRENGSTISGSRQTVYRLHHLNGQWKIVGFLGFLPL
jgi:hypothetical protein